MRAAPTTSVPQGASSASRRIRPRSSPPRRAPDVLIENAFTVNAPAGDLWSFLLDVERIAPCMPGAELTEVIDERNWKGKVHMKVGPVAMSFAGTVSMESRDDEAHRVVLRAKGTEQKGKG